LVEAELSSAQSQIPLSIPFPSRTNLFRRKHRDDSADKRGDEHHSLIRGPTQGFHKVSAIKIPREIEPDGDDDQHDQEKEEKERTLDLWKDAHNIGEVVSKLAFLMLEDSTDRNNVPLGSLSF
jgi:hypothetical protein